MHLYEALLSLVESMKDPGENPSGAIHLCPRLGFKFVYLQTSGTSC